jgi:hypothetical protein
MKPILLEKIIELLETEEFKSDVVSSNLINLIDIFLKDNSCTEMFIGCRFNVINQNNIEQSILIKKLN